MAPLTGPPTWTGTSMGPCESCLKAADSLCYAYPAAYQNRSTALNHGWHRPSPYQAPTSVYGRCLEPCSAVALNQAPLCPAVHQTSKSPPLPLLSHSSSPPGPQLCGLTPCSRYISRAGSSALQSHQPLLLPRPARLNHFLHQVLREA